jgi:hypothetical protein
VSPPDDEVRDEDVILRRIRPDWFVPDATKPQGVDVTSQAFQNLIDDMMSVHVLRILEANGLTAESVLAGHDGYGLVQFTARYARDAGQEIELDPQPPDDPAHAHMVGDKSKSWRKRFAKGVQIVVYPPAKPPSD